MSVRPETVLGERYKIERSIAAGGMGEVWFAHDSLLNRPVAIKVIHRYLVKRDPTFAQRFAQEAQAAACLDHPNIVTVYDYCPQEVVDGEPTAYLVMQYVDGEPLTAVIKRDGMLDAQRTLSFLQQAAAGLGAAHAAGIVHRDIKPGNLLVRKTDRALLLTDFGLARALNGTSLTHSGMTMGTAQYMAPEQAVGKPASGATDVYSLGVVGYECLTGVRPFDGETAVRVALMHISDPLPSLPSSVPAPVRVLIEKALSKDPKNRFLDGAGFAAAIGMTLEDVAAGRVTSQIPVTPSREAAGGTRKATQVIEAAGVGAAGAAAAGLGAVGAGRFDGSQPAAASQGARQAGGGAPPRGPQSSSGWGGVPAPRGGASAALVSPPPPRRNGPLVTALAALLVLAVIAIIVLVATRGSGPTGNANASGGVVTSSAPATSPTSTATTTTASSTSNSPTPTTTTASATTTASTTASSSDSSSATATPTAARTAFTKTINTVSRYNNERWATVGTVSVDPSTNLITLTYDAHSTDGTSVGSTWWASCLKFNGTSEEPKGHVIAIQKAGVEEKGTVEYQLPSDTGLTYQWNFGCSNSWTDAPLFTY